VFWFGAVLSLVTGVVCGLYPRVGGQDILPQPLKDGGHQTTSVGNLAKELDCGPGGLATTLLLARSV